MTVRFLMEDDFDTYIDMPSFEFGESYDYSRAQANRESYDGFMSVTDRGFNRMPFAGIIREITSEQRWESLEFFRETLQMSMTRFWIRMPNPQPDPAAWNPYLIPIYCGATVGSVAVDCDDGYTVGERIPADYEYIGPLRLKSNGYKVINRHNGIFEVSINAVIEHEE